MTGTMSFYENDTTLVFPRLKTKLNHVVYAKAIGIYFL